MFDLRVERKVKSASVSNRFLSNWRLAIIINKFSWFRKKIWIKRRTPPSRTTR